MTEPTPATDSYGTPEGVVALAGSWAEAGEWLDADVYQDGTSPNLTAVVRWIDQVSAMLNTALASYGFDTPLTSENSLQMAAGLVEEVVADIVKYAKNNGRYFTEKPEAGLWNLIAADLNAWLVIYAPGIDANGDPRTGTSIQIGFRSHDEKGRETFPIFQRNAFGNRFTNWNQD